MFLIVIDCLLWLTIVVLGFDFNKSLFNFENAMKKKHIRMSVLVFLDLILQFNII